MKNYLELLKKIKEQGIKREDRTGVGTLSLFGEQLKFDLNAGFPAITTKKLFFRGVVSELLWFLRGDTNIKYLHDNDVHIWDEWASADGSVGKLYGYQWRNWNGKGVDQISSLINGIKTNPYSRRHVLSAWNVEQLGEMFLPPCHPFDTFYVADNKLSCMFTMRSTDVFLGLCFNIASYALLTHMIAQVCGLGVDKLVFNGSDTHLYVNHLAQVDEQLGREPYPLPKLWLNPEIKNIDDFTIDDIRLIDYQSWPAIKAPIAV